VTTSAKAKARALLADIDETRAELIRLARSADAAALTRKPSPDRWSALENIQHLLFAEQLHLGTRLEKPPPWSALGLSPKGLAARFPQVNTKPASDLAEVLRAWNRIHRATQELADHPTDEVLRALYGSARHLRTHKLIIERLLRKKA
jgi:hypothetical protein